MKLLSVFFTDSEVVVIEKKNGISQPIDYASAKLPQGYIVNGIIHKYDELVDFLENLLSRTKISSRNVNLLLHEQIVTYKAYELPDKLRESKIRKYLLEQINIDKGIPFEDPIIDYKISYLKGIKEAIVYGASNRIVEEYEKLLKAVGLRLVKTDLPSLATYRLYNASQHEELEEDFLMFTNVYDNLVSINIFNRQYPDFNFVSQIEIDRENLDFQDFVQTVQDEIYRINNYYVWNLRKGKIKVDKVVITPMTSNEELNMFIHQEMLSNNMSGVETLHFIDSLGGRLEFELNSKYLLAISNTL